MKLARRADARRRRWHCAEWRWGNRREDAGISRCSLVQPSRLTQEKDCVSVRFDCIYGTILTGKVPRRKKKSSDFLMVRTSYFYSLSCFSRHFPLSTRPKKVFGPAVEKCITITILTFDMMWIVFSPSHNIVPRVIFLARTQSKGRNQTCESVEINSLHMLWLTGGGSGGSDTHGSWVPGPGLE